MNYIENLTARYSELGCCENEIFDAVDAITRMYHNGGKLLMCGNGGSAADTSHIAGELLKGFLLKRTPSQSELEKLTSEKEIAEYAEKLQRGVCAISLTEQSALLSAYANDVDSDAVYAQLVFAMHKKNDVFWGISTSGNSKNVVLAASCARALGLKTVALTGESGGKLAEICEVVIKVPAKETYKVQEYHLPVYHAICAEVEERLFGDAK
ncbi:MAG: SIS domain-containing protein [Ruminococcaceae bacterium]|nr:SIS domain-containing protein [Oscillospiraceae bacterium]